ncbi:hypothetical protein L0Y65_03450 [Candidatus Micrarchaeota archaeon]|nr:hypothetical protein [Candidatus Micrarchaeota archaeon]
MAFLALSISSFYGTWANWLPLSLVAVIAAVLFHTILLMVGRAFSVRELEAFAKSEILQAAATAFMAIFLVAMVGSAMEITQGLIHGEVACGGESIHIGTTANSTMDQAYYAIRCRLQSRAAEVAAIQDGLTSSGMTALEFNAINMAGSIFGVTFIKGDWFTGLYRTTETTRITNNLATVMLIGLNAQSSLLEYLRINMLHVFIPVGILLRSFYITRGPGALFIALGIGMYFIFPIFFVLLDPGFVATPLPAAMNTAQTQPLCYPTMTSAVSILTSLESAGFGSSAGLTFDSLRNDLSKSYVTLMLHPLVAFFMTMVFVRYMMSVLGGDTFELTKMVGKVI